MTDQPISWMTLDKGTRVLAADGEEIGTIAEVVADREKDIFSGVSVSPGLLSGNRFVPADLIGRIEEDSVSLTITSEEASERLETY